MDIALALILIVQLASIVLAHAKQSSHPPRRADHPKVTILRPVCGLENNLKETLNSTFLLDYPDYEIVFCVAHAADPVVPPNRPSSS